MWNTVSCNLSTHPDKIDLQRQITVRLGYMSESACMGAEGEGRERGSEWGKFYECFDAYVQQGIETQAGLDGKFLWERQVQGIEISYITVLSPKFHKFFFQSLEILISLPHREWAPD